MRLRPIVTSRYLILFAYSLIVSLTFDGILQAQPFSIGRRVITYTDPERGNRSISTDLFYPSSQAGNNVPIASGNQQFPVVVFGHGFVIPVSSYSWLADSLVKYGYILALPSTESGLSPSHEQFGKDLSFLCGKLKSEGTNPSSFLYQRVWPKTAVGGHSMGGGSSFLAAAGSPDINAIFNFAAAETNPSATNAALSVNIPALVFSGSNDCIVSPAVQLSMYNNLTNSCKTYINITGALHCQFANNNGTCAFGQITTGCNNSPITPGITFSKVQSLLLPFLDYFVKDVCARGNDYLASLSSITGVSKLSTCSSFPSCGVVPVRLVSFTAARFGNVSKIRWSTVTEDDVLDYVVETKSEQTVFREIARIKPRGGITGINEYQVTDDRPVSGTVFYRLHMLLRDGRSAYSSWVRVTNESTDLSLISISPNPGAGAIRLTINAPNSVQARLLVYDQLGQLVSKQTFSIVKGTRDYPAQYLSQLPAGVYRLVLRDDMGKNAGHIGWIKQ